MDIVDMAFQYGRLARRQGELYLAINHFTRSLEVFHSIVGSDYDRVFWANILFARAEAYLVCQQYHLMEMDIKQALNDCPQQIYNLEEARIWFHHGSRSHTNPMISVWCCSVALHFAAGDNHFQSEIYSIRALSHYDFGDLAKSEQDIDEGRKLSIDVTLQTGMKLKQQGIQALRLGQYTKAANLLELAEMFSRPPGRVNPFQNQWYECWRNLIIAFWYGKMYGKAIEAGNKWRQMEAITNQDDAIGWKERGNEMFKEGKYESAIDCYSLSIQYAPRTDNVLLGTLHSNRSYAYFQKKQFKKAKDDAEKCLEYRPKWSKSFYRLGSALMALKRNDRALAILKDGLNINATDEEKYDIFRKIMTLAFNAEDILTKVTFELPHDCLSRYLKECFEKYDWKSLEVFLLGGGGHGSYTKGKGGIATGNCDLKEISLCDVIKSDSKPNMYYELISVLIDHGALVDGRSEQDIPLACALNCNDHHLAFILLKNNANPQGLLKSKFRKHDDTPVHTAFRIGLLLGQWQIFVHLMENSDDSASATTPYPDTFDKKGNSLYHLVASGERMWHHAVDGVNLLRKYTVDPTTRNKDGKTPLMMIRLNDPRYRLIEESVKSFAPDNIKKKKKRKKKSKSNEKVPLPTPNICNEDKDVNDVKDVKNVKDVDHATPNVEEEPAPPVHCPTEIEILREKISRAIEHFELKTENETKQSEQSGVEDTGEIDQNVTINSNETISSEDFVVDTLATESEAVEDKEPLPAQSFNGDHEDNEEVNYDMDDGDVCDDVLDNLTWEVECTAEVWKKLKSKKLPYDKKRQIVRIIRQLANGQLRGSRAKRLAIAKESKIRLFEAKLDKSARILWERAIAFSPRCSALSDNKDENGRGIYTEVIRIWDIVFDHDTVPRKIEKIVRSYNRGTSCFIKKNLKGIRVDRSSLSKYSDQDCIPKIYVPREDSDQQSEESKKPCTSTESSKMFFPPGSPEETEYHILKFYAFSNAMVNAMLDNQTKTTFDFPFRVSELEHSVINLAPKRTTSILLLGRSGTGKTTCCLYRLWNNYQTYWQRNTLAEPSIPNVAQFIPRETDAISDAESEEEEEGRNEAPLRKVGSSSSSHEVIEDDQGCSSTSLQQDFRPSMEQDANQESGCQNNEIEAAGNEQTLEHLHQAFITKNAVLCKEVQKNFIELSQACFPKQSDDENPESSSVYKFDQLEEEAWPLFVCSRNWLLMLDASLPGEPFFPRDEDGKLERSVKGWGEEDNNLQEIPVEYSDDEDEDDEDVENKPMVADGEPKAEGEADIRREVTYQVFKNELWRKMTKKKKVDYHPSLVWTEIISFIKGSVEALHSESGYITLEEYQTIGNKRAPSFTADRETIYELFLAYQRIKRSEGMFDEADVVHKIYHRLEHHVPTWSIHEIYVDETQDFTQAELSVIIRSCRNPNRLFFTGDTAQSIMRGIAFRFSDLRSLFYYMKESVKSVGQEAEVVVPDRIYELTHNYRSHSGILNLASSVTDLLTHFFPESFDKLARDQGLFEGPKPVLLESCSFSDLAVILRGHKRKTSPIEFGAHQVILVASDEVRDSLPEELSLALVMTIYEAKGLEFDDVLIYNFFKNSQAGKEWRVVGTYEENKDEDTKVSATGIAEIQLDNLECKARPLEFNPDQHKILVSEFKYLYTALTRARVNVWLFDESEEARAPMFEYFQKRGVVDVKKVQKTEDGMSSLEGMFAQKSDKEEWKKQGLFFYGKGLWKVAAKCFAMAGEDMWLKKCNAHDQAANAAKLVSDPRKLRLGFAKAADLFLECHMKDEAEKCLYNARERILLAKLHEKSKNFLKAAKIFQKEGKFPDAARNFECGGDFERAVDCLLKVNRYNDVLDLVSRYNDLIQHGHAKTILKHPRYDQRNESICYRAAKYYQRRGDHRQMSDALERLPNVEDRITFLQKNGFFDQAAELLLKEGKAQEAARLMRSKGKFLEAAKFSDDDKFIADCYLLAARSTFPESGVLDIETERLLERATEMYKKCNNLNGQAEVKFARGSFNGGNVEDLEEAGKMFYQVANYSALSECFVLLMKTEKDPRKFSRPKAMDTLHGLLYLILAFYKESNENSERTAIAMCHAYFGLQDTDDVRTKRVPQMEMVRFSKLQNVQGDLIQNEVIQAKDADRLIKDHLSKMARNLIEQLWKKHKQINDKCKPCPCLIAGTACDVSACNFLHSKLTREHFADRFYALLFLVRLENKIGTFLKDLKRESAKVKNQLQKLLFIEPEFTACQWLYELLFPKNGEPVSSYFLGERDVSSLRRAGSARLIEFAKTCKWYGSSEEKRRSSSDLFIEVSNLMHISGAPVENLLSVEERRFERTNLTFHPAMFPDRRIPGRFTIFSKALERSKNRLYFNGDILGSVHAAVKEFLFTPAKKRGLPYPSIANAVMILERHLTACLILYARIMMNETTICLPESYLSMINFWDFVDRPQTNRSTTFYNAVQYAPRFFQGPDGQRNFDYLLELMWSIVELTFGVIIGKYNIVNDVLCDDSVNLVETERVLVLVLVMLCNCGRGIPEECEILIREHLFKIQLRQDMPEKLTKCIEDVRNASSFKDVVLCLRELLTQNACQERLCDVKWDDVKVKASRRYCKIDNYSVPFRFEIDVSTLARSAERGEQREKQQATDDEMNYVYSEEFTQEETQNQRQEYNEQEKVKAILVIERAFLKWKDRQEAKRELEEEIKTDAVKLHFQVFKLDKSGCTICGHVQFVDSSSNITSSEPFSSLDQDEETTSTWQPRILQRNTFDTHCAKGSPHWKKEKQLANFKKFYKRFVVPAMQEATQLKDEMTKLREESDVDCLDLDLDRLDDTVSRLQRQIKKVEDERSWDTVNLLQKAAKEVNDETQRIKNTKSRKGAVKPRELGTNQDSGDEDEELDDDLVGRLKVVNSVRRTKRNFRSKDKRR